VNEDAPRDAQLVQAAQAGDRDAFGQLVVRYQDRLFNSLSRMVASPDDAADAVQDALIQAFLKLDTFRGDSRFYTWVYRIAMNVAFSHKRRKRPSASLDDIKENVGDEPAGMGESPEDIVLSQERIAHVQAALDQLGDEHRQILVLRDIEGFAYEEIADVLGLPVGTVRSRIFRGRSQMKDILSRTLGEETSSVRN
jgi:RNA polymerase sigma-70 factor (ECF subfamily)